MPRQCALSLTSIHPAIRVFELRLGALHNSLVKPFLEVQRRLLQLLQVRLLHELLRLAEVRPLEVGHEIIILVCSLRILLVVTQQIILQLAKRDRTTIKNTFFSYNIIRNYIIETVETRI